MDHSLSLDKLNKSQHLPNDGGLGNLLAPIVLPGGLTLRNRVAMLPLTRTRAHVDGTPSDVMVD